MLRVLMVISETTVCHLPFLTFYLLTRVKRTSAAGSTSSLMRVINGSATSSKSRPRLTRPTKVQETSSLSTQSKTPFSLPISFTFTVKRRIVTYWWTHTTWMQVNTKLAKT